MQCGPIRRLASVSSIGVLSLLLIGGCTADVTPAPYTLSLKELHPSEAAPGCPLVWSEWLDRQKAAGKLHREPHKSADRRGSDGSPILAAAPGKVPSADHASDRNDVRHGQQTATMGETATGPGGGDNDHLHFFHAASPRPTELNGGKRSQIPLDNAGNPGGDPRLLWYPYTSKSLPPAAGAAHSHDASAHDGDKDGVFFGLNHLVPCG